MRCAHCKRSDTGVTVNHVRACALIAESRADELTPNGWTAWEAPPAPVVEEGFYFTGAEYVKVLRGEPSGHLYAKVWDGRGWEYTVGLMRLLTADMAITAEQAQQFGVLYSRCVFCTRKLTDDRSIAVGYGPDCAEREGLPWGQMAASA
jgi:hypothetical protein